VTDKPLQFVADVRDLTNIAMNRAQRRAIDKRPDAVFVAVPRGCPLATGERFKVPGIRRGIDGWVHCAPGEETMLTAVQCR